MLASRVSVQNRSRLTGRKQRLRPERRRDSGKGQWKLSKDGQFLKVDRAVRSRDGTGTVHFVFRKNGANLTNTAAEAHMVLVL